jgi:RNA polymerase sigma-70 factor, ECF subfamily
MGDNPGFVTLSDKGLVQTFQAGERAAYDEIYIRYRDRVRRTCARILPNPQDAEEATQEAFLRAYQALGRFNGSYQLGAWLTRIAANVSIDLLRSRSRSAHLVGLPSEGELAETQRGPEDLVAGGHPRVDEALEEIQPLHAQALQLRAVHGMSHDEMAGRLHMSPAQVKALLHRARRSFKRAWEKAEGWALAPIFLIRSSWSARSGDVHHAGASAANVAAFTAPGVPLLVEKAAATAALVALALTGAPTGAETPDLERFASQPSIVAPSERDEARIARTKATVKARPAANDKVALALPDEVQRVVDDKDPNLNDDDDNRPDDDDDNGLFGPGSSDAEKAVKKVGKKVEEILP